jgi:hypothetical protein
MEQNSEVFHLPYPGAGVLKKQSGHQILYIGERNPGPKSLNLAVMPQSPGGVGSLVG